MQRYINGDFEENCVDLEDLFASTILNLPEHIFITGKQLCDYLRKLEEFDECAHIKNIRKRKELARIGTKLFQMAYE